jgi:putative DNA primase/helicase
MQDLETPYMPAELKDKFVNIGDDISVNVMLDGAMIKILCGTMPIMAQEKYGKPYALVNEAKFIFSCNKMPIFKDNTDGLYRRLEIIEITNRIAPTKRNSNLLDEFTHEDMQYLLWQSFLAINKALKDDHLAQTTCCAQALEKFRTQSSTFLAFAKRGETSNYSLTAEAMNSREDFIGHSLNAKYNQYIEWCAMSGKKKQSYERFIENACIELNLQVINGKFEAGE